MLIARLDRAMTPGMVSLKTAFGHLRSCASGLQDVNQSHLWETSFAQTVLKPCEVFRSAKQMPFLDICNARRGIELSQASQGLPRFREPACERVARRGDANGSRVICLCPHRFFCPGRRRVVAA